MIFMDNIAFSYGDRDVIKNFTGQIPEGKITAVLGPNGSGKSTLFQLMTGQLQPQNGTVRLKNKNIDEYSKKKRTRLFAYLPQQPSAPYDLKVVDLVSYGRYSGKLPWQPLNLEDKKKIDYAMLQSGCLAFSHRKIGQLSGGERQRAWIAMALVQEPELLFLDEPTTYLDMAHQFEVLNILKEQVERTGITVVMILHDLNQGIRYGQHVWVINEGVMAKEGRPEEIMTVDLVRQVFHMNGRFINDGGDRLFVPEGSCI